MEIGVYIRQGKDFKGMLDLAQEAERLNYFGVFLNDHVHGFAQKGKESYLEAWTTMTAIGVLTNRIRIGQIVLFNSLRNPAFLAKSVASLDRIINGRYELLIGAGWNKPEYEGYDLMGKGRGMPSAKERVDRFKESLQILKGMLNKEVFSFEGKYWTLKDAINITKPVQKNMRISVGASKPRMLKITAKYADGLNISSGIGRTEEIIKQLRPSLEKNDKSVDSFYISGFSSINIAKNDSEYESIVEDLSKKSNKSKEEIKKTSLTGTTELLVEKINKLSDYGMKMIVASFKPSQDSKDFKERMQLFYDEVKSKI